MFLNCENIILGVITTTQKNLINHLFIILKMYIFASKCKTRDPSVIGAIRLIKCVHMVEEGVAVKKSLNLVRATQKQEEMGIFTRVDGLSCFLSMSMCTIILGWWCMLFFLCLLYAHDGVSKNKKY